MRFSELDGARDRRLGRRARDPLVRAAARARLPARPDRRGRRHDGDRPARGARSSTVRARACVDGRRRGDGARAAATWSCARRACRSTAPSCAALRARRTGHHRRPRCGSPSARGAHVIGVTGTKGKSTTAALTAHLLARARARACCSRGNIGAPALDLLDADPRATAVVELSSYQIADLDTGPARSRVVTNLYREHLDWHGSLEALPRATSCACSTLPGVRSWRAERAATPRPGRAAGAPPSALRSATPAGWDVDREGDRRARAASRLRAASCRCAARTTRSTSCAALTALEALGVRRRRPPAALAGFEPLAHRLQTVARARRRHVGRRQHLHHAGVHDRRARELPERPRDPDRRRPGPRAGLRRARAGARRVAATPRSRRR